MAIISEIAPDVYRISVYAPALNLQFNHFLVRDEQPLLFNDLAGPTLASLPRPSPFAGALGASVQTAALLDMLAGLAPQTIAAAHGSSFVGDGAETLRTLRQAIAST